MDVAHAFELLLKFKIQKKTYVHTFIFRVGFFVIIFVGLALLVAEERKEDWKMGTSYL